MVLEKYARRGSSKTRPVTVRGRIPEDLAKEWFAYLERLDISCSEAIYYLIREEMQQMKRITPPSSARERPQKGDDATTKSPQLTTNRLQKGHKTAMTRLPGARFTVTPFVVQNQVPCPICRTWVSRSNVSRHMKDVHRSDTESVYTQHKKIVEEMVKEAQAVLGEG